MAPGRRGTACAIVGWLLVAACQDSVYVLRVPADAAITRAGGNENGSDAAPFLDMGAPETCGPYRSGPDFRLCAASYAGGAGEDRAEAVDIGGDRSVVIAGNFAKPPYGLTARELGGTDSGAVLRLGPLGTEARSFTRIGARVYDMEVQHGGNHHIAVGTERGVIVLDALAQDEVWDFDLEAGAKRIAIGDAGTVAALDGRGTVHLWNAAGSPMGAFGMTDPLVADVAVDDESRSVFVVGGRNASGECTGLSPFLRAHGFDTSLKWRAYDFVAPTSECASSQGVRVAMGRDGKLYYAGENQGGNTVHLKDPMDPTVTAQAPIVGYDAYTIGYGRANQMYGFVASFEPDSGVIIAGQVLLPRDGDVGGRLLVNGVAADAGGNVYLAGEASCCLADRDALELGGAAPGPYDDGDMFVAILAPGLGERLSWVTWTGADGVSGVATSVAADRGVAAVVANQRESSQPMITHAALQAAPGDAVDAFFSIWPAVAR